MFLLPQHFQRQEIYYDQQLADAARVSAPFSHGFRELQFDAAALENWELVVTRASGRTKSGTVFDFAAGEVGRLNIKTAGDGQANQLLQSNQPVQVYLAFPTNKPNNKNVSDSDENSRYHEFEDSVFDLHGGGNERPIVFKKLRAVLSTSNTRQLDYEYLPIAQLVMGSSASGQIPKVSETYLPPATVSLASEPARQLYQEMANRTSAYLLRLIEFLDANGFGVSGIADQDVSEAVFRYFQISEFRGWLMTHNQSPGTHPFANYQYLCGLIGRMAIVDPSKERLVDYPKYDHDEIFLSLKWAWDRIRRCYVDPGQSRVRRIPLIAEKMLTEAGEEVIMKGVLGAELFESDWELFLGFDYSFGKMTKEDANLFFNEYLSDASTFYWKLGSHDRINRYFVNREQGVWFENPTRTKNNLPRKSGWIYADIIGDEYWDAIKQSGTLCLRIDQKNLRTPMSDLGTEKITVGINQKTFQYRVSVFAVNQTI